VTKAVLFDLDGTFADTAPDLAAALNHARDLRGLPPLPLQVLRPQASHGAAGLLKAGFGIGVDAPDFTELRKIFLDYYASHICEHTRLFPGIAELVDMLEARGIQWGIVTNKPHRFTVPLMEALGYATRAACLVSGDTFAQAKPHPKPLLGACEIMKVAVSDSIYMGDDLRDMQAAHAAQMRCIIARFGYVPDNADFDSWGADGAVDAPLGMLDYI
jgi:N-acetyl-D-muramate 6-phosphate phosphatase